MKNIFLKVLLPLVLLLIVFSACDKEEPEPEYICGESIYDIEGNKYATIEIAGRCWMSENLRTTRYNDNTSIANITEIDEYVALESGAFSWYEHDYDLYGKTFGALYNFHAVNSKKLCPDGWEIPSDYDWNLMADTLGGEENLGGMMKQTDTIYWNSPNLGATNSTGFNALPGGYRHGATGEFEEIGEGAYYWTSTALSLLSAWNRKLLYDSEELGKSTVSKSFAFSVRCIKTI